MAGDKDLCPNDLCVIVSVYFEAQYVGVVRDRRVEYRIIKAYVNDNRVITSTCLFSSGTVLLAIHKPRFNPFKR